MAFLRLFCTYLSPRPEGFPKDLVSASDLAELTKYVDVKIVKSGGKDELRDIWGLDEGTFDLLAKALA
jgi:hypothetical protein